MARRDWPSAPEPLPVPVVDNHTHLEAIPAILPDGVAALDVAGELARAGAVGVDRVVQIGCDLDSAPWSISAAEAHENLVAGIAVHPNEAVLHAGIGEDSPDGLTAQPEPRHEVGLAEAIATIADLAHHERVRTISETGLDYFRAGPRGRAVQRQAFRDHLAIARELDLPVQIHDRDAHADVLEVLAGDTPPPAVVFHCFSGGAAMASECVRRGYYLSFAGPLTFRANDELRTAAQVVPQGQLLVETDAPYLTPHPHRGAPNAPYLVPLTVRALASIRGEPLAQLCSALSDTANDLYGPFEAARP